MKKTLHKTDELFRLIDGKLKEEGRLPEILDYGQPTHEPRPVKTMSWDTIGRVSFGSSEGIYLDICLEGDMGGGTYERVELGTYKTLLEDKEAFSTMSLLNTEFVFAMRDFVNTHMDDFNWVGFDIIFYIGEKQAIKYTTTRDLASAREFIQERGKRNGFDHAVLINNETGKEEIIQISYQE